MESARIVVSTDNPAAIQCNVFVRQVDSEYQQNDELRQKYEKEIIKVGESVLKKFLLKTSSKNNRPLKGEIKHIRKVSTEGLAIPTITDAIILARPPALTNTPKSLETMRKSFAKYYRSIFLNISKSEPRAVFPVLSGDEWPLSAVALFIDNLLIHIADHGSNKVGLVHELIIPCNEQQKTLITYMLGDNLLITKRNVKNIRERFESAAFFIHSNLKDGMSALSVMDLISETSSAPAIPTQKWKFTPFLWTTTSDDSDVMPSSDVSMGGTFKKPLAKRRKSIEGLIQTPPITPTGSSQLPRTLNSIRLVDDVFGSDCDCTKRKEELDEQQMKKEKEREELENQIDLAAQRKLLDIREKNIRQQEELLNERMKEEAVRVGTIKEAQLQAKRATEELRKAENKLLTAKTKRDSYRYKNKISSQKLQRKTAHKEAVHERLTAEQDFAVCSALGMGVRARRLTVQVKKGLNKHRRASEVKTVDVNASYHKDVLTAILKRIEYLVVEKTIPVNIDNGQAKMRIALSGDKGGTMTKIGVSILDIPSAHTPNNFFILAHFNGSDDYDTLSQCLPPSFWQSIESLHGHQKSLLLPHGHVTLILSLVVCADLKFVYTLLGHKGSTSSNYCPACPTVKIPSMKEWDLFQPPLQFRGKAKIDNALSIAREPLLHLSGDQIILPGLHIVLGLVTKAHQLLKALLKAQITKQALDASGSVLEEIAVLEKELEECQLMIIANTEASKLRARMAKMSRRKKESPCAAITCLYSAATKDALPRELLPWAYIECSECSRRFHRACDSFHQVDSEEEENGDYSCAKCQGLRTTAGFDQLEAEMVKSCQQHRDEIADALERLKDEHAALLSSEQESACAEYKLAEENLHTMEKGFGISSRNYYSTFIGRDVKRLADNAQQLWDLLDDKSKAKAGVTLFRNILLLRDLFNNKNTPADEQSEQFVSISHHIRNSFHYLNPNETVTVKCHLLEHGPVYLEKIGKFSDFQDGLVEQLHQWYNGYERRYCSIPCPETRMAYMARVQNAKIVNYVINLNL